MNFNNIVNDILNEGILDFLKKEPKIDYDSLINQYKEDLKNLEKDVVWAKNTNYKLLDSSFTITQSNEYMDECIYHIKKYVSEFHQAIISGDKKAIKKQEQWLEWNIATLAWGLHTILKEKYIDWDYILNQEPPPNKLATWREDTKTRKSYYRTGLTPSVDKTFGDLIDEL